MEHIINSKVSIISPCRNEVKFIDKFIHDVLKQNLKGIELEILIADGESNDGTRTKIESLAKKYGNIKLIKNPGKIVSKGLNLALNYSKSEFIVRMDIHTKYSKNYVYSIVQLLRENDYQCVGGPWVPISRDFISKAIKLAFQSRVISGGAKSRSLSFNGLVDTVYLGAWKREYLIKLGGFDENFIRNQDDELSLRIIQNGGKIFQSSKIKSQYFVRNKFSHLFKQYFQYGYWKFPILLKHKYQAKLRHFFPSLLVLTNLLFFIIGYYYNYFFQTIFSLMFGYYSFINLSLLIEGQFKNNIAYIPISSCAALIMHFSYGIGYLFCFIKYLITGQFHSKGMSSLSR